MNASRPTAHLSYLPYALLAALLLSALPSRAQAPAKDSQGRVFEGTTQVFEVDIPVFVIDKLGESVEGLTADDFKVLDGREEREIVSFEIYDSELSVQAGQVRDPQAPEPPSLARRKFLLLFDLTFSSPVAIEKARRAARDFVLEGLRPDDLAAIATFSIEYGPKLLVTFTEDRAQLARGIDTLGLLRRPGQIDPLRFFIDNPGTSSTGTGDFGNDSSTIRQALEESGFESMRAIGKYMQRGQRAYDSGRVESWAAALSQMAKSLDSVRGRKQVLLFSEGFDGSLFFGRAPMDQDRDELAQDRLAGNLWMVDTDESYGNSTLQARVQEMLQEFRRSDAVLHSLDIGGLRTGSAESLDQGVAPNGADDALFFLANETGGAMIEDTNDVVDRLDDVLARSRITYVLSIRPGDAAWDGAFHPLEVSLRGRKIRGETVKSLTVSHRSGYYAPRPFEEVPALERSLLAADAIAAAEVRDDIGIEIMATPFRSGVPEAYLPVVVEVKGSDLLPAAGVGRVDVELFAYASDLEGSMKDFFSQHLAFDVTDRDSPMAQNGFKFYGQMLLPKGEYLLRVLVREVASGQTGVRTQRIEVPDFASDEMRVFPVFYDEPRAWLLAREQPPDGATSVIYPFVVNGVPIVPSARPVMHLGESAGVMLIAYNLPTSVPQVGSVVRNQAGHIVARNVLQGIERTVSGIDGVEKLRARFSPDGLEEGVHSLHIEVTDPLSGRASERSLPFVVIR